MRKNVASQRVTFSLFKSGARIASPTMAAGDFKVALDGGAQANVATLPTTDAAGWVTWLPSQAETNADVVTFLANDVAGAEWEPLTISFDTFLDTEIADHLDADVSSRAVAGDAMTLTAATLTSIAAAVWNRLTAAIVTVGSIGKYILDKLSLITTGAIAVTSPITAGGNVTTYRGDSYLDVDGRALEWQDADFPTLTGATISVIIENVATFAGSVAAADTARLELTAVQSATIPKGRHHFQVVATLGNLVATLVAASWVSRNRVED